MTLPSDLVLRDPRASLHSGHRKLVHGKSGPTVYGDEYESLPLWQKLQSRAKRNIFVLFSDNELPLFPLIVLLTLLS